MKNSFLIYYDFEEQTAALTDAQVGRLMRMIRPMSGGARCPQRGEPELITAFRFQAQSGHQPGEIRPGVLAQQTESGEGSADHW